MSESFAGWWDGLGLLIKFFYIVGATSTAILGVQTLLSLFGFESADGADADVDFDVGDDADAGVGFLSLRTIVAFLVGFGWMGAILLKAEISLWLVFLLAPLVGLVLMVMIFLLMKLLWSLRDSGTLDYRNAIGEVGSVYLPIPGDREGKGQVEVLMQGRLQTVPAVTSRPERLENRSRVLVVEVEDDNTLVVVPDETGET